MRTFRKLAIAIGFAAAAAVAPLASAAPTLTLDLNDNAGNTASVVDLGVLGFVIYLGPLGAGNWTFNNVTGLGDLVTTDPGHIDLNSINVSSAAGGHLTLKLTETGINYAAGAGILSMLDAIGGTLATGAGNHIDWVAKLDGAPGCAGTFVGGGGFTNGSCNFNALVADLSNFSIALQVDIYHSGKGTTSFDNELLIPEPGTLLLVGAGLLGLAGLRRRKLS